MALTSGGCHDLRRFMNDPSVMDAFSKLISGKSGYQTVVERRVEPVICPTCHRQLEGEEKFCPECGTKIEKAKKEAMEIVAN